MQYRYLVSPDVVDFSDNFQLFLLELMCANVTDGELSGVGVVLLLSSVTQRKDFNYSVFTLKRRNISKNVSFFIFSLRNVLIFNII